LLFVILLGPNVSPARGNPTDSTVFIRVVGALRVGRHHRTMTNFDVTNVELATGTGFVISPFGHVLTNHHVLTGEELHLIIGDELVEARLEVERIEVVFPAGLSQSEGARQESRYAASVDASDAERDLALLSTGAADLPFIKLGDSDALVRDNRSRFGVTPSAATSRWHGRSTLPAR
jgi:S1-C subfamily serine protease